MTKLTALHIHNSRIVGGIERSLIGWMDHFDRERFAARLFCFEEADGAERPFLEYLARRAGAADRLPWGRRRRIHATVSRLVRVIRENRPCLVHTHDMRPDGVGRLAARLGRCPWIASVHGWHSSWAGLGRKRRVIERLRARLLTGCDLVIAVSDSVRQESIRRGLDAARVVTLHTGIDLGRFDSPAGRERMRAGLGIGSDEVVVGHIARLHPEKGHALLLRAFARAHPRLPGARLLIVGDGTLARSLRDEARRLAISDRVTFLGFQDDLVSLLVALDVFVLPSFAEGTPLAIYEAMAAGLPIIASNVPGIGELVHHGESGFLVPPGDLEALTDALIRLAGDAPELRASLGRRARAIARHDPRWSIETSTRRLESLYDMVVAQRGVRREWLM